MTEHQAGGAIWILWIDFDSRIQKPVVVDGSDAGQQRGQAFLSGLKADGGTHLHDAVLAGRNWLKQTGQKEEILAVVVLTDGRDQGSTTTLSMLQEELRRSGFEGDDRIAVFSVGYGEAGAFDSTTLQALADGNGGDYLQGTPDTIRSLLNNLQLSF